MEAALELTNECDRRRKGLVCQLSRPVSRGQQVGIGDVEVQRLLSVTNAVVPYVSKVGCTPWNFTSTEAALGAPDIASIVNITV